MAALDRLSPALRFISEFETGEVLGASQRHAVNNYVYALPIDRLRRSYQSYIVVCLIPTSDNCCTIGIGPQLMGCNERAE